MLTETGQILAAIVPLTFVADVAWMLKRNASAYIDDDPNAWNDGDMRLFEMMNNKLGDMPFALFVMSSIIYWIGTFIGHDVYNDAMRNYSGVMLQHKQEALTACGFWAHVSFVSLNMFAIGTRLVLNHLRAIRRLEKKSMGIDPPTDETAEIANVIVAAFGGLDNIDEVDADITRVRITTKSYNTDPKFDTDALREVAAGVVHRGTNNTDLIIGTRSDAVARKINKLKRGY